MMQSASQLLLLQLRHAISIHMQLAVCACVLTLLSRVLCGCRADGYRWSAKRGQEHAVQRADKAQHPSRELPLLHH